VYVAGHRGLAGSALVRALEAQGASAVITRTRDELDLKDAAAVRDFFQREQPDVVYLAAARVGGILANDTYPAEFIQENLAIQYNVIHEAWQAGVQQLLFLSSSCIYPRECPQPIREDYLLTGPLEPTNRPFALAKIAGIEMCWAYNRQYGTRYMCAMSTNLYGPNDTYDLQAGHVLPAMMRRFHEAKLRGDARVTMWGTGAPRREFLHSDDMAAACLHVMQLPGEQREALFNGQAPLVNIGCGEDRPIRDLAYLIREIVGAQVEIDWDTSKPDGTPRKLMNVDRVYSTGWRPRIALEDGLREAYAEFRTR